MARTMEGWKHGDPLGQRVMTAHKLTACETYNIAAKAERREDWLGFVKDVTSGHGTCFLVLHIDGTSAWYDPEELTILNHV